MEKAFLLGCLFSALAAADGSTESESSEINVYELLQEIEDLQQGVPQELYDALEAEVEANFLKSPAPLGLQNAPHQISDTSSWEKITFNSSLSAIKVCLSADNSQVAGLLVSYYDIALKHGFSLETHGDLSSGNCSSYEVNDGQAIDQVTYYYGEAAVYALKIKATAQTEQVFGQPGLFEDEQVYTLRITPELNRYKLYGFYSVFSSESDLSLKGLGHIFSMPDTDRSAYDEGLQAIADRELAIEQNIPKNEQTIAELREELPEVISAHAAIVTGLEEVQAKEKALESAKQAKDEADAKIASSVIPDQPIGADLADFSRDDRDFLAQLDESWKISKFTLCSDTEAEPVSGIQVTYSRPNDSVDGGIETPSLYPHGFDSSVTNSDCEELSINDDDALNKIIFLATDDEISSILLRTQNSQGIAKGGSNGERLEYADQDIDGLFGFISVLEDVTTASAASSTDPRVYKLKGIQMVLADLSVVPEQNAASESLQLAESALDEAESAYDKAVANEPIVFEEAYIARLEADTEIAQDKEQAAETERQKAAELAEQERIKQENQAKIEAEQKAEQDRQAAEQARLDQEKLDKQAEEQAKQEASQKAADKQAKEEAYLASIAGIENDQLIESLLERQELDQNYEEISAPIVEAEQEAIELEAKLAEKQQAYEQPWGQRVEELKASLSLESELIFELGEVIGTSGQSLTMSDYDTISGILEPKPSDASTFSVNLLVKTIKICSSEDLVTGIQFTYEHGGEQVNGQLHGSADGTCTEGQVDGKAVKSVFSQIRDDGKIEVIEFTLADSSKIEKTPTARLLNQCGKQNDLLENRRMLVTEVTQTFGSGEILGFQSSGVDGSDLILQPIEFKRAAYENTFQLLSLYSDQIVSTFQEYEAARTAFEQKSEVPPQLKEEQLDLEYMILAFDLIISDLTADVPQVQNTTCVTCHTHEEDTLAAEQEVKVIRESFNSRKVFYNGDFIDGDEADERLNNWGDILIPLAILGAVLTTVLGLGAILIICHLRRKIDEDEDVMRLHPDSMDQSSTRHSTRLPQNLPTRQPGGPKIITQSINDKDHEDLGSQTRLRHQETRDKLHSGGQYEEDSELDLSQIRAMKGASSEDSNSQAPVNHALQ